MTKLRNDLEDIVHEEKEHQDKDTTQGKVLEQFVDFLKANWRTLLKEVVVAGVTTYVSFRINKKKK